MLRRAVYGPCRRLYSTAAAADSPQASVACTIPLSLCAAAGVTGAAIGCFVATALIHVHRAWKVDREPTQQRARNQEAAGQDRFAGRSAAQRVDAAENRAEERLTRTVAASEKWLTERTAAVEERLTERMDRWRQTSGVSCAPERAATLLCLHVSTSCLLSRRSLLHNDVCAPLSPTCGRPFGHISCEKLT